MFLVFVCLPFQRPQAAIDGQLVTPPYQDDDFTIFASGIFMVLVVPDIGLEVRFLPQGYNYFRVVVPLAVYYNNTDGLCGKYLCSSGKVLYILNIFLVPLAYINGYPSFNIFG